MTVAITALELVIYIFSTILLLSIKGSIIILIAWLTTKLLHRSSASMRHAIWCAAFAIIFLLPLTETLIPHITLSIMPSPVKLFPFLNGSQFPGDGQFYSSQLNLQNGSGFIANILPLLWLAGVVVLLGRNVLGMTLVGWICHRKSGDIGTNVEYAFQDLLKKFSFKRPVKLILSELVTVPMTTGILNPVVILPAQAGAWSKKRIKNVLLHELSHIGRWDIATKCIAGIVRSVFWFNPLFWMASDSMRNEMERACDESVLCAGVKASDYALDLVKVAARAPHRGFLQQSVIKMSGNGKLENRVENILNHSMKQVVGSQLISILIVIVFSMLIFTATAVNPYKIHECYGRTAALTAAYYSIDVREAEWALEQLINGLQQHLSKMDEPGAKQKTSSNS